MGASGVWGATKFWVLLVSLVHLGPGATLLLASGMGAAGSSVAALELGAASVSGATCPRCHYCHECHW